MRWRWFFLCWEFCSLVFVLYPLKLMD
jgi:hypothetical protein